MYSPERRTDLSAWSVDPSASDIRSTAFVPSPIEVIDLYAILIFLQYFLFERAKIAISYSLSNQNHRLSKAMVELISAAPYLFLNLIVVWTKKRVIRFIIGGIIDILHWYHISATRQQRKGKPHLRLLDLIRILKLMTSVSSACWGTTVLHESSSHLVSRFSNMTVDPIDLISSSPLSGDGDDISNDDSGDNADDGDGSSGIPSDSPTLDKVIGGMDQPQQKRDIGLHFGVDQASISFAASPLILPCFLLWLQQHEDPTINVDLSFLTWGLLRPSIN
ncbi:hypothetical protein F511_30522 [Dorcoceras hygrometricum]|uniref:Uncharacterized protein n=1 Tax=Dorcoceras hygrometricum TaxID=472368 RepID=A0A2Z7CSU8_9LAMI|nr:hypothetical protein F511_30522 [Dorcoceras hygrometricum]